MFHIFTVLMLSSVGRGKNHLMLQTNHTLMFISSLLVILPSCNNYPSWKSEVVNRTVYLLIYTKNERRVCVRVTTNSTQRSKKAFDLIWGVLLPLSGTFFSLVPGAPLPPLKASPFPLRLRQSSAFKEELVWLDSKLNAVHTVNTLLTCNRCYLFHLLDQFPSYLLNMTSCGTCWKTLSIITVDCFFS